MTGEEWDKSGGIAHSPLLCPSPTDEEVGHKWRSNTNEDIVFDTFFLFSNIHMLDSHA